MFYAIDEQGNKIKEKALARRAELEQKMKYIPPSIKQSNQPRPALNAKGYAQVTFVDYYNIDAEQGTYTRFNFRIMDVTRISPIAASVFTSRLGSTDSNQLLYGLGFAKKYDMTDAELVRRFCLDIRGADYYANVYQNNRGNWLIDISTLRHCKYTASDYITGTVVTSEIEESDNLKTRRI